MQGSIQSVGVDSLTVSLRSYPLAGLQLLQVICKMHVPSMKGNTAVVLCCSVAKSYPPLCDPTECSTPGLPVLHYPLELAHIHVHRVSDAIQPSHPLSSPSPPAPNPSLHQGLFQRVSSSHEVA